MKKRSGEEEAEMGKAAFVVLQRAFFSSAAIKVRLRSNESMGWGLSSLCCVLCPPLMGSRCGGISQVWLWKTFPHINPIRSDPEHELAGEQASVLTTAQTLHRHS